MTPVQGSGSEAEEPVASTDELPALRILVAEDNSVNQMIIRSMLEQFGQDATIVGNGQEAVEMLTQTVREFDLVLLDYRDAGDERQGRGQGHPAARRGRPSDRP